MSTETPSADPPIPPQLLVHLREGRLVLFAGAGLSAQAGLPTWRSLLQDIVDATIAEAMQGEEARAELKRMIEAGKWLQIADHCKVKLGPGGYARLLGERLGDTGRPVPEAHRLAVRLPFAAWITTNYDKLLERAYAEERGGLPKTLTNLDTEALGRLLFDGAPFVLKAHGDLDKPDSLVFTSRDYRDLIHGNTAFSAAFSAILLTHSVLFLGYSLSDPDFNLLLDQQLLTFRGFAPERYALMSGIGKVEEEYLWRVCQIRVIPYPEGRHEAMPAFLQRLADRLEPEVTAAPRSARAAATTITPRQARPGPALRAATSAAPPLVLSLDWRDGAAHTTLSDGSTVLTTASGPREPWATLAAASRSLESSSDREASFAACSKALARILGPAAVKALARAVQRQANRPLRLELTREAERLPWELLGLASQTLAELAPVFRAPVGVSDNARGLPAIGAPLRALVVGDTKSASPGLALPGAAAEARAVADEIARSGVGAVTLLLGPDATYNAVASAFDALDPDVFHFAGHAWFDEHEAYLELADRRLTATMVRPWLTRRSPALMFLNSHYTAFIPAGVENPGAQHAETAISAGLRGRPGFSDLAMRSGVGAFVGTFNGAIDDSGARDFAVSVYRALLLGATAAAALQSSRHVAADQGRATALLYCLYGEGGLRLINSGDAT